MKTFVSLWAFILLSAALCFGESFNGKLVDSSCLDQQHGSQKSACVPTASTTAFAIETQDGQTLKLDNTGNTKAAEMLRGTNVASAPASEISVTVTGTKSGKTLRVESIEMQK